MYENIIENTAGEEYISIPDFAKLAGVTKQAVYQRVSKDLSVYCKVDGKSKLISTAALSFFAVKSISKVKVNTPENSQPETAEDSAVVGESSEKTRFIDYLIRENQRLTTLLEEKEKTIAKKDELIAEYTEKFATIAEQEQHLTLYAQQLHAAAIETPAAIDGPEDVSDALEPAEAAEEKLTFWDKIKKIVKNK